MVTNSVNQIPQYLKEEYPFVPKIFTLKSGHNLSYVDEGEGEAVIMLHGNPTWSFYYRDLIKKLSPQKRTLVPDHLGCGLSDKPQDYEYTLENHIRNTIEWIEGIGIDKFSLIVHDWGGAIGMGVATRLPKRVQKIVLLNTAAFRSKRIPFSINLCRTPLIGENFIRVFNGFAWPATKMAVKSPLSSVVKKGYLHPYNNFRNRIATAKFVQDIPLTEGHPSYPTLKEIEEKLRDVKAPKLILWGGKDFCFDMNFYKRWKEIYPEAKSHVFEKAGHYVLEDAKEAVGNDISQFLQ